MVSKNIICIESSLLIDKVIEVFIDEKEQKNITNFTNDKKQELSKESILLFDNYMNEILPNELLDLIVCNVLIVRVTNFEHWKEISSIDVLSRLNLLLKNNEISLFSNLN